MENIRAFPGPIGSGGMSLRQYYIGCAIQGLLSNPNVITDNQWKYSYKDIVELAKEQVNEIMR